MKNVNLQSNRVTTLHHTAEETAFGKKSFVPVSSYQAISNDDLEHTNTGGEFSFTLCRELRTDNDCTSTHSRNTVSSWQQENGKLLALLEVISGFLSSPFHKETPNDEAVLPDLEPRPEQTWQARPKF